MEGLTFHIENEDQVKSSLSDYEMINFSFCRTVVILKYIIPQSPPQTHQSPSNPAINHQLK